MKVTRPELEVVRERVLARLVELPSRHSELRRPEGKPRPSPHDAAYHHRRTYGTERCSPFACRLFDRGL